LKSISFLYVNNVIYRKGKGTYKKQIPKKQIPNNKKYQIPNPKFQKGCGCLEFIWNLALVIWLFDYAQGDDIWNLFFVIYLGFVICFL